MNVDVYDQGLYTIGIFFIAIAVVPQEAMDVMILFMAAPVEILLRPLVGQVWIHDWMVRAVIVFTGLMAVFMSTIDPEEMHDG